VRPSGGSRAERALKCLLLDDSFCKNIKKNG
jgi:hypothetical protein